MEFVGKVEDIRLTKKPFEMIRDNYYIYSGSFWIRTTDGHVIEVLVDGVTKELPLSKNQEIKVDGDVFELTSNNKKERKLYAKSIIIENMKFNIHKYRSHLYSSFLLLAIFLLVLSVYPIFGSQIAFYSDIFSYVFFALALIIMFVDYNRIKKHSFEKL